VAKGNLWGHTQRREGAAFLETVKAFRGRIPVTSFRTTDAGRAALKAYHAQLRALLPEEQ